jgi:serine phosphatase RsbU (regulator of sigma subunit)
VDYSNIHIKRYIIFILLSIYAACFYGQQVENINEKDQDELKKFSEMAETAISQGNLMAAAKSYNKAAFIYWKHGYFRDAIDVFLKSASIYEKHENLNNLKAVFTNIGVLYTDLQEIELAEGYFKKAVEIARKIGEKTQLASGLTDLAYILSALGKFDESNEKLNEALEIAQQIENNQLQINIYGLFAENFKKLNQPELSTQYKDKFERLQSFRQTQTLKDELVEREVESQAQKRRSDLEQEKKELEIKLQEALLQTARDSLSVAERLNLQRKAQIKLLKQDSTIKAQEKVVLESKQKETEALLKQKEAVEQFQRVVLYGAAAVIVLAILAAISLFIRFRDKKKANRLLESRNKEIAEKSDELSAALEKIQHQNKQITKSINYSKGIQRAMLPDTAELNFYIPESFILFKPRDIVSGDFYWFRKAQRKFDIQRIFKIHEQEEKTKLKKDDIFLVSAVDCTGHGVPGAFMSMIGYNLLDDITNRGVNRPDLILEQLHKGVKSTLKQDVTDNKDGMDMAFCQIDIKEQKINFAGAKNPLVYIQDDEIFQLKADKLPIGGTMISDPRFTLQELKIEKPTYCYLFSDGYVDQFGGPNGRKYMAKKFRNLLLEIHKRPMDEQKEILDLTIEAWMGENYSQIDDILVIGFKIGPDFFSNI